MFRKTNRRSSDALELKARRLCGLGGRPGVGNRRCHDDLAPVGSSLGRVPYFWIGPGQRLVCRRVSSWLDVLDSRNSVDPKAGGKPLSSSAVNLDPRRHQGLRLAQALEIAKNDTAAPQTGDIGWMTILTRGLRAMRH